MVNNELKKKDSLRGPFETKNVFQFKINEYESLFDGRFVKESLMNDVLERTINRYQIDNTKKFKFFKNKTYNQSEKMKQKEFDEKVMKKINELIN